MFFFSFFEKIFKVIHFFHILPSLLKVFLSETQSSCLNAKYSNAAFIKGPPFIITAKKYKKNNMP